MVASARLYLLLLVMAVPFALSYWWPAARTIGFIGDLLIIILLIVDFQLTPRAWLLNASREVTDRFSIGRNNEVLLRIENTSTIPLQCRVKDDFPDSIESSVGTFGELLPPDKQTLFKYELLPRRRGNYQFGDIHIRYLSFLGLFWRQISIPARRSVKVYSDLKALHDLSIRLSRSSELGELHQRKRGQGTDFASLREYTVGDDSKAIDWKATARKDRPVIRTYEAEQEQRLLILIDAGRMMISDLEGLSRFDHALNAALCLALTGLTHNDQVGIGIFADKPLLHLPSRRGKSFMKNILEAVFDVEPKMVEPDYASILSYFATAQKGRCLMVVLTDLTDPTGSNALLAGLASLSSRHLPFCVTLKDRQVLQIANPDKYARAGSDQAISKNNVVVADDIFRRAVATDLLAQRELALNVLQRRGCLVLDCPPQELSDKLVDSYLEIKTRARL